MTGAAANHHPKEIAGKIFDQMARSRDTASQVALGGLRIAGVPYGVAEDHYPVEFMAALLTSETSKPGERGEVHFGVPRDEHPGGTAQRAGVGREFYAVKRRRARAIGFGLAAIKNVGAQRDYVNPEPPREAVAKEGKQGFGSLWEFCDRVDLRLLNKRVLESLIKAGANGRVRAARTGGRGAGTRRLNGLRSRRRTRAAGQSGLFGSIFDAEDAPAAKSEAVALPPAPDWDEHTRLQNEKEVLGFFVSGHPLDKYAEKLRKPERGGHGDGHRDEARAAELSGRPE